MKSGGNLGASLNSGGHAPRPPVETPMMTCAPCILRSCQTMDRTGVDVGTICPRLTNILGSPCISPKTEMGGMTLPDCSKTRDTGVRRRR